MPRESLTPETCPNPEVHGNPFRNCTCGWTEEPKKPNVQHTCLVCGASWTAPVLTCPECPA